MSAGPELREGFIEGCLEKIGEDDPEEEQPLRDLWEDETQREVLITPRGVEISGAHPNQSAD